MRQPVLLTYNLSGEKAAKVRMAAMRLRIRVRPVQGAEYGVTLEQLCAEPPAQEASVGAFLDEMMVMAYFPAGMVNAFLQTLRRMGVPPVPLKAVLTPTNAAWDSLHLHQEIAAEHAAMQGGAAAVHAPKA